MAHLANGHVAGIDGDAEGGIAARIDLDNARHADDQVARVENDETPGARFIGFVVHGTFDGDSAGEIGMVEAGVVRIPQLILQSEEVINRLVHGQTGVAGDGKVDATRAIVEGTGRGDAIFLGDAAGDGGEHQGRLNLARRPVGV